jgi:hypothetical protein
MMSGRRFLQLSLALPLVAPILLLPLGNVVGDILFIAIGMGIWEYLPFALLMLWLLHRAHTYGRARLLMGIAPVIYVLIVAVAWAASFLIQRAFDPAAKGLELLPVLCVYGLVIGYGYVLIVAVALGLSHMLGWIRSYELLSS